ncbi:hypothetical protein [Acetobacterium bakii]|uniref:Uncharacterized protein n=1 Tax=Acetobacterium bakii TaxID=52689 RepID=A0A0L6U028_9FIRM|nr:hypothetical protein [Acetobacterium bakii]KNZ41856.1 hypothetical protein AKG39_09560 [Acetobacterium bakii]
MDTVTNKFHADMLNIYKTAKKDLNYSASRLLQLVAQKGGVKAAKQLISTDRATDGFWVLCEHKRLDLSVEVHVLKPEYAELFTESEKEICRNRLRQFGYEV